MRPASWIPPVLWMAVILWLASDSGSAEQTGRLLGPILRFLFPGASPLQIDAMHGVARKLGHAVEYAALAGLWLRAFVRAGTIARRPAAWRAWMIAAVWAMVDESYQSTVGSRTGSPFDVLIDAVGALAVAVPAGHGWRPTADRLTGVLLWIAAIGGAGLLALNVGVGVESGLLWLTVPAAVIALALFRRRRRRSTAPPPTP